MCATTYALGHSSAEILRLKNQGDMLRPITERLLRSARIHAGMRVLDLGCGAPMHPYPLILMAFTPSLLSDPV